MNNCINIYTENASYSLSIEKYDKSIDIYDFNNTISITCAPPVFTYPGDGFPFTFDFIFS